MVNHILLNNVFLKNLSPLVTADVIKEFLTPNLSDPDEILRIDFRHFPGSVQRFCQVDFRTSAGVTAATSLNGHSLLGVPVVATVIDPLYQTTTSFPTPAYVPSSVTPTTTSAGPTTLAPPALAPTPSALNVFSNGSGVSSGAPANFHSYREPEIQQLNRTVHVANIPDKWELDRLIVLLSAHVKQLQRTTLVVTDKKLIEGIVPETGKPDRIALIEFKTSEMAEFTRKLPAFARFIDGRELVVSQAKTTVSPREPDNVSFDLPPSVPVPVAYQQLNKLKLQEKIARARSLAQGIIATAVSKHTKSSASSSAIPSKSRKHDDDSEQPEDDLSPPRRSSKVARKKEKKFLGDPHEKEQHQKQQASSKLRHRESPFSRQRRPPGDECYRSPVRPPIKDRRSSRRYTGYSVSRKRYSSSSKDRHHRIHHRSRHRRSPLRRRSVSEKSSVEPRRRHSYENDRRRRRRSTETQKPRKRAELLSNADVSNETHDELCCSNEHISNELSRSEAAVPPVTSVARKSATHHEKVNVDKINFDDTVDSVGQTKKGKRSLKTETKDPKTMEKAESSPIESERNHEDSAVRTEQQQSPTNKAVLIASSDNTSRDLIKSFRTVTNEHEMTDRLRELKEELRRRLKRSTK